MSTRQIFQLGGPVDLVANILLASGLLVMALGGFQWGVAMIGLGLFGPYFLRETGVLPWRDEFQREVIMRSGMHALLAVGLLVTVIMVIEGVGGIGDAEGNWSMQDTVTASTILLVLATTWILSRTLQFWGTIVGARRFLLGYFGVGMLGMVILLVRAISSDESLELSKWLLAFAPIGWLGLLTLGIYRWPQIVGWLLLGSMAYVTPHLFAIAGQNTGEPTWIGVIEEACMLVLPLLIPGFALITYRKRKSPTSD